MALCPSSDSSQSDYNKLQQQKRWRKSYSLSQRIVVVKPSPNSKRADRKAEKNGSEE